MEEVTDESVADDDEDDNFANYITDEVENDDFDFRENYYDTAWLRKSLSDPNRRCQILRMRNWEKQIQYHENDTIFECSKFQPDMSILTKA